MPIKYAEITIIINEEKETMTNYFNRILFGNENKINDNDTIIILFDDESVYDIKNIKPHKNFNMGPEYYKRRIPVHFEIEPLKLYFFSKDPTEHNGILKLNFKPIFSNSQKFLTSKREPSEFNVIYYDLLKKI